MREPPGIGEEVLRACLQEQYDLGPVVLEFLPLGHDYDTGVYRVVSVQSSRASASQHALRSSWKAHQSTIHTALTTLEKLAEALQSLWPTWLRARTQ